MTPIDSHEAANLEMMFGMFSDRQMIRELVRRGRLHVTEYTEPFFTELADDDRYMASITYSIASHITRVLIDQKHVLFQDTPPTADPQLTRIARRGSIVVLRERGAKRDGL